MRSKEYDHFLDTKSKHQIEDSELISHMNTFRLSEYRNIDMLQIKEDISNAILLNPSNNISGYEHYSYKEFCIGVTHFIDNLIMKHGLSNLQIFQHDYAYYQRLDPNLNFATLGKLKPNSVLIMSMPFAGHCDVHNQMGEILAECTEKNIDVHLDCAWLTCAEGIKFNFNHPCIKSFASSLSKCYTLDWNRIGIRWSRTIDENDSITIFNKFNMYNKSLCMIGYHALQKYPINYYWTKYKEAYLDGCKKTFTFPTKIIWLSKDLNGNLYGVSRLVQHLHDVSVSH